MNEQAVELVESRPDVWAARFEMMRSRIQELLPAARIEHIGSTSVAGIPAKDVVDILVGVGSDAVDESVIVMSAHGFDCEGQRAAHSWLSWPHRADRSAVVHAVVVDESQWRDRLAFRDILRREPEARKRYLLVKEHAAARAAGWGDYTAAKAGIVHEILEKWS